jgi:alkaline phosphatase
MKRSAFLATLIFVLYACNTPQQSADKSEKETPKVKNVILMIGDGMGLSQVSSAFYYKDETPNFKRFKNIGLIRTSSAKQKITDSAAGATAFASGVKSYNGAIGVDVDTMSVPTINEILFEKGWKTGVIATSSVTHATPASFYAHAKLRRMQDEIAAQLTTSDIHFAAGGGQKFFSGNINGQNTYENLEEEGFIVNTMGLDAVLDKNNRYAFILSEDGMPRMLDGRGAFLSNATAKAIDYFSLSDNPFFIMIEGSQIDWGGHANDAAYIQTEVIDFDNVIGQVLDFAEKDGETLVIVTADHETGGYTLSSNDGDYNDIKGTFSTGGHSTTLIPVFAFGPGAGEFQGIYENSDIFHKIMEAVSK